MNSEFRLPNIGVLNVSEALQSTLKEVLQAYTKGEEVVIRTFAARNGIRLPDPEKVTIKDRAALASQMILVHANIHKDDPADKPDEIVVQRSWCVDRRNGQEGFEETFPQVMLVHVRSSGALKVVIRDIKE